MKKRENSEPGTKARSTLAKNLRELMEQSPDLDSHAKLAKRAKVGSGSIGYMLDPDGGNPTLHNIAKVAQVWKLEAWQLLHPELPTRVLSSKEAEFYDAIQKAFDAMTSRPVTRKK